MAMGTSSRQMAFTFFCLFILKVTAQEDPVFEVLDLAKEAFDDQYIGCREAMEVQLEAGKVLNAEKENSPVFRRAWNEAERRWHSETKDRVKSMLPEGFHDLHGVAVVANSGFIRNYFNKAVKSAGKSYRDYMDNFHYKALHYYLTVAMQLLAKGCRNNSEPLYRGFENVIYDVSNRTNQVKFGHFFHTSSEQLEQLSIGNDTFLTLHSCFAVPIAKFSEFPHEMEVLVSGSEIFTIEKSDMGVNDYNLVTTGKQCSNFNCAFVTGAASKQSLESCMNSAPPGTSFCLVIVAIVSGLLAAVTVHL